MSREPRVWGECACGCGGKTALNKQTKKLNRYVRFHSMKNIKGKENPSWRGGTRKACKGYVQRLCHGHPRADSAGYVQEHILVMEKALGRFIKKTEAVHHIDENRRNNVIGNLMLFATNAMHNSFHRRLRAFKATGNWEWIKCPYCKQWDAPENMFVRAGKYRANFHRNCRNVYERGKNAAKIGGSQV